MATQVTQQLTHLSLTLRRGSDKSRFLSQYRFISHQISNRSRPTKPFQMARNGESFGHRRSRLPLALAGLFLSTAGFLLQEPLLTISQKCPDKISIVFPVYAYLFLLLPLCFCLNMLLLLLHVWAHADAPEAHSPVFLTSHLSRAAHTASLATLLLSVPLSFHVAVAEEHVGSAIGAALVCLALVIILTSVFKKILISSFRTSLVPALFALCISAGYLISFDPLLSFSEKNHYDPLTPQIPINLVLLFICFIIFMLGIILVILCISAPANGGHASIFAKNLVIASLSVSFAALLVGGYIKFYGVVTEMAAVVGESIKV